MRLFTKLFAVMLLVASMAAPAMAAEQSVGATLVDVLHQQGVIDDAAVAKLKAAQQEGGDKALNKELVEVLHQKGILGDDAYGKLSAQADKEKAAVPAAPMASAASDKPYDAGRPVDKTLSAVEEGFAKMTGDTLKLKIGLWLKTGWVSDDAGFSTGSSQSLTSGNQFYVRTARPYLHGQITDKLGWRISFDTAASTSILRDGFVWMDYIPYHRVTVGQFLVPWGLEGIQTWDVHMINNSMAVNFIQIPWARDIGATVQGKYENKIAGLPLMGMYNFSVVNGNSLNAADNNDAKDLVVRVMTTPLVPGMTLGGSWYGGKTHVTRAVGGRERDFDKDRDRYAASAEYLPPYIPGLRLKGEFLWDRRFFTNYVTKNVTSTAAPLPALNRHVHAAGWYTTAWYKIDGLQGPMRYLNGLEPLFRYDALDEDMTVSDNERSRYTFGFNYYLSKYARVKANWEAIHADGRLKSRSLQNVDNIGHHLFTSELEIWF